ncbi:hypothetical protein FRC17_008683 [Serendipita sp. 399]|nr:hypothetical protein FRC17_008683 [Serendipita sp. 399]
MSHQKPSQQDLWGNRESSASPRGINEPMPQGDRRDVTAPNRRDSTHTGNGWFQRVDLQPPDWNEAFAPPTYQEYGSLVRRPEQSSWKPPRSVQQQSIHGSVDLERGGYMVNQLRSDYQTQYSQETCEDSVVSGLYHGANITSHLSAAYLQDPPSLTGSDPPTMLYTSGVSSFPTGGWTADRTIEPQYQSSMVNEFSPWEGAMLGSAAESLSSGPAGLPNTEDLLTTGNENENQGKMILRYNGNGAWRLHARGSTLVECPYSATAAGESIVLTPPTKPYDVHWSNTAIRWRLSFDEESLSKAHILALFTPPLAMEGRQRIMNTIQYVLGLLPVQFSLQRFIELVDQEKWDEESINFISTRQTLLTMLVSRHDLVARQPLSAFQEIIVDLTDPVLLSAGAIPVLMDMVLSEFLSAGKNRHKLIVLNDAQEYLTPDSVLTKSLVALASSGTGRPASIIVMSTDPHNLPPPLFYAFDFLAIGHTRSIYWKNALRAHIDSSFLDSLDVAPGECALYSPESCRTILSRRGEEHTTQWKKSPVIIRMDDLVEIPDASHADAKLHHQAMHGLTENITALKPPMTSSPVLGNRVDATLITVSAEEQKLPNVENVRHADNVPQLPVSNGSVTAQEFPPTNSFNVVDAEDQFRCQSSLPDSQESKQTMSTLSMDEYPQPFHPLIGAIIAVGGRPNGVAVDFEAVRKQIGNRNQVQKLGWCTFTQFVNGAKSEKIVEVIIQDNGQKLVKLIPRPKSEVSVPQPEEETPSRDRFLDNADLSREIVHETSEYRQASYVLLDETPLVEEPHLDLVRAYLGYPLLPLMMHITAKLRPISRNDTSSTPGPSESTSIESIPDSIRIPCTEYDSAASVERAAMVNTYPPNYRPLAMAILQVTDNRLDTPAYLLTVKSIIDLQGLCPGFTSFTTMVTAACADGYVEVDDNKQKDWIKLIDKRVDTQKHTKLISLNLWDYPQKHSSIVSAILNVTLGCARVRARYPKLLHLLEESGPLRDCEASNLVFDASKDKVIQFGSDAEGIWLALEPPTPEDHRPIPPRNADEIHNVEHGGTTSTSKDLSRFKPLLTAMRSTPSNSQDQLLFSQVGTILESGWKQKANVKSLKEYLRLAESEGLVSTGGIEPRQWVRLSTTSHNAEPDDKASRSSFHHDTYDCTVGQAMTAASRATLPPFSVYSSSFLSQNDELGNVNEDLFACVGDDRVYRNGHRTSFGLVFGSLIHDLYAISQKLVSTHLQHEGTQLLVLSGGTTLFKPKLSSCTLGNNKPLYLSKYGSLNRARNILDFSDSPSKSIGGREDEVTKAHILALFTPPPAMSGAQRIMTTIQFVLSQLDEIFDLQRLIELVEQEKWEEEAVTFIAFRQTILTMLISPPDEDIWETLSTCRQIVIDLNDPVLLSAGLVPILMDMAIHRFLSSDDAGTKGTKKLIVFDNAQEYLSTESMLTKSLMSLASMNAQSPSNILLIATDPSKLHPSLHFYFDFLLLGHFNPRSFLWKTSLSPLLDITLLTTTRLGEDDTDTNIMQIWPGQFGLYSPESIRFLGNPGDSSNGEKASILWNQTLFLIGIDDLASAKSSSSQTRKEMPPLIELDDLVSPGPPFDKREDDMIGSEFTLLKSHLSDSSGERPEFESLNMGCSVMTTDLLDQSDQQQQEFVNPLLSPASTNEGPVDLPTNANENEEPKLGADIEMTEDIELQIAISPMKEKLDGDALDSQLVSLSTLTPDAADIEMNVRDTNSHSESLSHIKEHSVSLFKEGEEGDGGDRYHPTDYAPQYRELVSAILRVTNGRVNVKARYSTVLRASMFTEDTNVEDHGGHHDRNEERNQENQDGVSGFDGKKLAFNPFWESRAGLVRSLASAYGVVEFGKDSEGVWVILNPPQKPTPVVVTSILSPPKPAPVVVTSTPSPPLSSTSVNFEPLRIAIREAGSGEGGVFVHRLNPPPHWKKTSGFVGKWDKFVTAAAQAGVVVREGTPSRVWLSKPLGPVPQAAASIASLAPPSTSAPGRRYNYVPLHAAIWRCGRDGKALVKSVIDDGLERDWWTKSGFSGLLKDYIESAVQTNAVMRGGEGLGTWLKIPAVTATVTTAKKLVSLPQQAVSSTTSGVLSPRRPAADTKPSATTIARFQPLLTALRNAKKDGEGRAKHAHYIGGLGPKWKKISGVSDVETYIRLGVEAGVIASGTGPKPWAKVREW